MTNDDLVKLRAQLAQHEGVRLRPYTDTVGKLTIGIGRNLTDVGISRVTADQMLDEDLARTFNALAAALPWFTGLDGLHQRVLVDMAFMGPETLLGFHDMLAALARRDDAAAAAAMLDSRWARQVQGRALALAQMLRTGQDVMTTT